VNHKRRIIRLPKAEEDLINIWQFSAEKWGEAKADEYLDDINLAVMAVAANPEQFPLSSEIGPTVRIVVCNSHILLTRTDDDTATLIRVLHQRMQITSETTDL